MAKKNSKTATVILISIFLLLVVFFFIAIKILQKKTKYSHKKSFYKCTFNYKCTSKLAMEIFDQRS